MELKAVNEYKAPEYSTYEESRNKILRLMMNCKKVSVGVLVMFFLCSNAMAENAISIPTMPGGLEMEPIPDSLFAFINIIDISKYVFGAVAVAMLICVYILTIKMGKSAEEEVRSKYKKKIKITLIGFAISMVLATVLLIIEEIINMNLV